MSYEHKPNTGTLWPNSYKKNDNHPDVKGDVYISRELLKTLASKNSDPLIKISVAGWSKKSGEKKFMSLSLSEPFSKPAQSDDSEDIPF